MKHSAKVMAFGMALTTAIVPQALAQKSHPANAGPPPLMSPQQKAQTQQKTQTQKQQTSHSRVGDTAAGAANRYATGNAGKDAAAGGGTRYAKPPSPSPAGRGQEVSQVTPIGRQIFLHFLSHRAPLTTALFCLRPRTSKTI
jgi:hypothetical protein